MAGTQGTQLLCQTEKKNPKNPQVHCNSNLVNENLKSTLTELAAELNEYWPVKLNNH